MNREIFQFQKLYYNRSGSPWGRCCYASFVLISTRENVNLRANLKLFRTSGSSPPPPLCPFPPLFSPHFNPTPVSTYTLWIQYYHYTVQYNQLEAFLRYKFKSSSPTWTFKRRTMFNFFPSEKVETILHRFGPECMERHDSLISPENRKKKFFKIKLTYFLLIISIPTWLYYRRSR